jgi:hypothetical protein
MKKMQHTQPVQPPASADDNKEPSTSQKEMVITYIQVYLYLAALRSWIKTTNKNVIQ